MSVMLACERTGATDFATLEFSGPTTPTTLLSATSLDATVAPTSAFAVSSCASIFNV
jgi:hypothetical protein